MTKRNLFFTKKKVFQIKRVDICMPKVVKQIDLHTQFRILEYQVVFVKLGYGVMGKQKKGPT